MNTNKFIEKSLHIHGNIYDYSCTNYVNNKTKVEIICKIHGIFSISPSNHIGKHNKQGCPSCGKLKAIKKRTFSLDEFIASSRLNHTDFDKYDFTKSVYINNSSNIIIKCNIHGYFSVLAMNFTKGIGCKECSKEYMSKLFSSNTNEFILKSKLAHGNKYDYSKVEYKSSNSKVHIICPIHGEFKQTPNAHTSGKGCKKCAIYKTGKNNSLNPTGWTYKNWGEQALKSKNFDSFKVYIIMCWNDEELFFKIGRTFIKTERRFKCKNTMPYNYSIIEDYIFDTAKEAFDKENELKRINKNNKYLPNINFAEKHECFAYVFNKQFEQWKKSQSV